MPRTHQLLPGGNPLHPASCTLKRTIGLLVTAAICGMRPSVTTAATFFVDNNPAITTHDGTSWATAYADLQQALAAATGAGAGDEIRVADGTYKPTSGMNRTISFQLKNGVAVRGGYAGFGAADPDLRGFLTTLSGNIGLGNSYTDNSYHVLVGSGTDNTAMLDGFTISDGFADGATVIEGSGGGLFNRGGSPTISYCVFSNNRAPTSGGGAMLNTFDQDFIGSSPVLNDCTFIYNTAKRGGAVHNSYYDSSPTFNYCLFTSNYAVEDGAGMLSEFNCAPVLTYCIFSENTANRGAGMTLYYENSNPADAILTRCQFVDNFAVESGGGMYLDVSSPLLIECDFINNTASTANGGGFYNVRGSFPTLTDCNFSGNQALNGGGGGMYTSTGAPPEPASSALTRVTFTDNAAGNGGGMYTHDHCSSVLNGCTFSGNTANDGGGMYNKLYVTSTLTDCAFSGNTATITANSHGGGMYNDDHCNSVLNGCTFTGNIANYGGGGMYNALSSSGTLTNCVFQGGNSAVRGGGMYCSSSSTPRLTACAFVGNSGTDGGGAYLNASDPDLIECTFTANSAVSGGGLYNTGTAFPSLLRCAFNANTVSGNGGAIINRLSSTLGLEECTFTGNSADNGGAVYNDSSSSFLLVSTFTRNSAAGNGGGLYNGAGSSADVSGSRFMGNSAGSSGGGIGNSSSTATLVNCLFSGNHASFGGGGIGSGATNLAMTNCTFSANSADIEGGALANYNSGSPSVKNCILWGDNAPSFAEIKNVSSSPVVTYTDITGGYPGSGNITANPLFVRNPDPGLDLAWGTDDDDYGDLRQASGSPCVDRGNNSAVSLSYDLVLNPRKVDDPASPDCSQAPGTCGTAPIVDMGAYEWQLCYCPGDINGDGKKDGLDIQPFVDCLTAAGNCPCADVDLAGGVNMNDLAVFAAGLLAGQTCP